MTAEPPALGRPHVFVVFGDVTSIECDAWLLPTDHAFHITRPFRKVLGLDPESHHPLEHYKWGDGAVVRWKRPDHNHHPQIWLGDVGRVEGQWSDDMAAVAAEFVECASEAVGTTRAEGRYPVIALPVIGTGHGGASSHKGEVYRELVKSLVEASESSNADVVLVLKHERGYSAAQRARRHVTAGSGRGSEALWDFGTGTASRRLMAAAGRLATTLRRGRLVEFVGAGTSAGLWRRAGIPGWEALLDAVTKRLKNPAPDVGGLDLRDRAKVLDVCLKKEGLSLAEVLEGHLTRDHYTLAHGLLASLGATEHVTTNFDTMLENALRAIDGHVAVLPYTAVEDCERWVLKLHGSVDRGAQDGAERFVITRDDYLSMPARYGALYGLVQALLLTRHMLFVGYSLRDEDFHRLIYAVRSARGEDRVSKMGTVLTLFEAPAFDILWPDLEAVSMVEGPAPTEDDSPAWTVAARRLLLFLDLLGHEAANLYRFLLDPDYEALLPSHDEQGQPAADDALHAALLDLLRVAGGTDAPGWEPVHRLLRAYGAEPTSPLDRSR